VFKAAKRLDPAAQFIVPDWGDKFDYGIGLLYWPVRLHRLATKTLYRSQLYPPLRDYEFGYRPRVISIKIN
jgi:hypothetical protein